MNTSFYHFLRSAALVVDAYLLDNICGHYIGNDTFMLGIKHLVCMDKNFGLILGPPYHGMAIKLQGVSHHNPFYSIRSHGYELLM